MELLHIDPQLNDVDISIICHCVLCVMKSIHFTHCCITQKAQNTCFHEHVINDFIFYVNQQIVTSKYEANFIVDVDQTNAYFNESSGATLETFRT
jgi:hypothetical protein